MMLDADIVAVSPSSVWRVLSQAGLLSKWDSKPSKKGMGFEQPAPQSATRQSDGIALHTVMRGRAHKIGAVKPASRKVDRRVSRRRPKGRQATSRPPSLGLAGTTSTVGAFARPDRLFPDALSRIVQWPGQLPEPVWPVTDPRLREGRLNEAAGAADASRGSNQQHCYETANAREWTRIRVRGLRVSTPPEVGGS
jgi:hypothetical protein